MTEGAFRRRYALLPCCRRQRRRRRSERESVEMSKASRERDGETERDGERKRERGGKEIDRVPAAS